MKRYVFLLYILATFASANNADIDQILEENQTSISQSETSQEKVDNLSTEKDSLLAEWKVVVKQVEGLKIYNAQKRQQIKACLLYTSPSPRDKRQSRMPSSA